MSFVRSNRLVQIALLMMMGLFWVGCGSLIDGGGGGINPTEPRFIAGTFKSEQGKLFVFEEDGSYKFFASEEKMSSSEPLINSKYEIKGTDIFFEREDGSKFGDAAVISEDGKTFTWAEHPGETFTKQEN